MKAVYVHEFVKDYEEIKENDSTVITVEELAPHPTLSSQSSDKNSKKNKNNNELLVKVLACSLSPGDVNMIEGNFYFLHPQSFPFIPGNDICGIVEETTSSSACKFRKGDIIVADCNGYTPTGGLAEYTIIPEQQAILKPHGVTIFEAAACNTSATTASNAVLDHVKENDRVLILGGSGGVGSVAIQLAKHVAKASFVATTSTQHKLCGSLGADAVIDYRLQNWWEIEEYTQNKFDVIIDTVGGGNYDNKAEKVLKSRRHLDGRCGEFVAVVGDHPKPTANTLWKAIQYTLQLFVRPIYNNTVGRYYYDLPKYTLLLPYDTMLAKKQVLEMIQTKKITIPFESKTPYPFTKQGICDAYQKVASGHAHGKVVISMT